MADETMTEDVFMAHMERAVRRSQEIWPDDWRNHHTFYDGEVARLLDTLRQAADEPRAIIRHFAAAMERKLAANDDVKGGWRGERHHHRVPTLLNALDEEMRELAAALAWYRQATETTQPTKAEALQDVLAEAADVANYAMLIADVVGALPPTDERGR